MQMNIMQRTGCVTLTSLYWGQGYGKEEKNVKVQRKEMWESEKATCPYPIYVKTVLNKSSQDNISVLFSFDVTAMFVYEFSKNYRIVLF